MALADDLADFVTAFQPAELSEQTMDHASMLVASTLASAALGVQIDSARIVRELALDLGGRPDALVWFTDRRLPLAQAAQVNAVASDAAASDDSDLRNIIHPGTALVAAALAAGEQRQASGESLLAAIVLGYEVVGRVGAAMTPGFIERGHHGSTCAIFGAVVTSGRLLGLDSRQMTNALALAATSIGGLVASANTSTAREHHAGLAAALGIHAVLVAERGFRAETEIFEMSGGFFETIGGVDPRRAADQVVADLGVEWDIVTDMAIKLMPGGHPFHAIAEAAANAAISGDVDIGAVEAIEIYRPVATAFETGPSHPHDLVSMAHSPAYFAAAGVVDRAFSWEHAGEEKIADPVIHRLIDQVRPGAPPVDNEPERYRQGATVTIRMNDGRTFSSTVHVPRGAGVLGVSWGDVDNKYRTLVRVSGLPDPRIDQSLARIHSLRRLAHISELTELLVK
jgi:2-methylcitrate dehydratase PrpD